MGERVGLGMAAAFDTFAMASGIAAARQAELVRKADHWLLGWFHKSDADAFVPAMNAFMAAWQERLASGRFASSREILVDIMANGSAEAKEGLALLSAGDADASVADVDQLLSKEARNTVTSYRLQGQPMETRTRTPRLLLGDLVDIEEADESRRAEEFSSAFDRIELASGNEAKLEVYTALAALKQTDSPLNAAAVQLEDEFINDPDVGRKLMRFAQGLTDPVNMSLMVAGFFTAHLTTAAAIGLIGRTAVGQIAFALPLVPATTAVAIESGSFVLAERALRQTFTADEVDWSGGQFLRDWGSLATAFTALRLVGVPLGLLNARAAKLGDAGKLAFGVGSNAAQAGAFYVGGMASYAMGLRAESPEFLDEWLMLIQFQLGVRAANLATGNWAMRQAAALQAFPPLDPKVQHKLERFAIKLAIAPLMPFGFMATLTPEQMKKCTSDERSRYEDLQVLAKRVEHVAELFVEVKGKMEDIEASVLKRIEQEKAEELKRKAQIERDRIQRQVEEQRKKMTPEEIELEMQAKELEFLREAEKQQTWTETLHHFSSETYDVSYKDHTNDANVKTIRGRMWELTLDPEAYHKKYGWSKDAKQICKRVEFENSFIYPIYEFLRRMFD